MSIRAGLRMALAFRYLCWHEDRRRLGHVHPSELDGAWRSPFAIFVGTKIGGGSAMPAGEVRRFQALTNFNTI